MPLSPYCPTTPPECHVASVSPAPRHVAFIRRKDSASGSKFFFEATSGFTFRCGPVTRSPSLTMALSVGFTSFVSSTGATQAKGLLTFTPVGLPPTEHVCPSWTHSLPKTQLAGHQRSKPRSAERCPGSNLERLASFQEKLNFAQQTSTRLVLHSHASVGSLFRSDGLASVKVMQAADLWNLDHVTEQGRLDRSAERCIFFERQLRTATFAVIEIIREYSAQTEPHGRQ